MQVLHATASLRVLKLRLSGHLTEDSLTSSLAPIDAELKQVNTRCGLEVDCLAMTGYDATARSLFVSWNKANRCHFCGVAIVTKNRLWHMVISSMSLASSQKMSAFASSEEAAVWLSLVGKSAES
jgi:ABC-type transporter Mla MlaB component